MGRVAGVTVLPMNALGDLLYGGAGSPTGYRNRALTGDGATILTPANGDPAANVFDGNPATYFRWIGGDNNQVNATLVADLGAPRRIGRFRYVQGVGFGAANQPRVANFRIQSSTDNAAWTTRYTNAAGYLGDDTGHLVIGAPASARYWRLLVDSAKDPAGGGWLFAYELELEEVTTVGAGNPVRLPPPAARRVLAYAPDASTPEWQAPAAANADTAGATLANLEIEVNELKAALRAAGILAP